MLDLYCTNLYQKKKKTLLIFCHFFLPPLLKKRCQILSIFLGIGIKF